MKITLIAATLGVAALTGCSMARGVHEDLPPAAYATGSSTAAGHVDVFKDGDLPKRPVIRIAKVAAHGNGYATQATLEETLVQEAKKVNADCLVITASNVSKDETIGTYGGGLFSSAQIQRPHLFGVACKYAQVRLGINQDKDHVITYVTEGSPAATAGIVEGEKIIAINGVPITASPYLVETEVSVKRPGDTVKLELLDQSGQKQSKTITLSAN
jgi:membrane-associated protease RseP (regulator of RpoE activity)